MNKETQISPVGYKVDVTRVPTRGTFTGQKLPGLIRIDKTNNTLLIKNNGRTSDPIELREDLYTPASLAKTIQKQIAEDKTLGRTSPASDWPRELSNPEWTWRGRLMVSKRWGVGNCSPGRKTPTPMDSGFS